MLSHPPRPTPPHPTRNTRCEQTVWAPSERFSEPQVRPLPNALLLHCFGFRTACYSLVPQIRFFTCSHKLCCDFVCSLAACEVWVTCPCHFSRRRARKLRALSIWRMGLCNHIHTHTFITHNSFTQIFCARAQRCHTHTTLAHTQLCHKQFLQQVTLSHTTLPHTTLWCTTLWHTSLPHRTSSHLTLSHTTFTRNSFTYTSFTNNSFTNNSFTYACGTPPVLYHPLYLSCLSNLIFTLFGACWEKVTCGLIRSFNLINVLCMYIYIHTRVYIYILYMALNIIWCVWQCMIYVRYMYLYVT